MTHIIHAVAPDARGKSAAEIADLAPLLKSAYTNSLAIASVNGFQAIGMPALGTGIFEYPLDHAAKA